MYQTILFDLDGTLTNSELGITNSVAYALGKYGIQVPDKKALRVFIGPPLQESFERFYGFSKEEADQKIQLRFAVRGERNWCGFAAEEGLGNFRT